MRIIMEISRLKTFKAVAESGGFHRASRVLHLAQSTVSAQVIALEEELGVRLFERLGRKILLTEAGERLLNYARKLIDLEEEAQAEVAAGGNAAGSLVVRVPESLAVRFFPAVIAEFRKTRPGVKLDFTTCTHDGLAKDLRKGVTDLGFLITDSFHGADMAVEMLGTTSLRLVAGPGHELSRKKKIRTRDLDGQTLLLTGVDCSYRRILKRLMTEAGVKPAMVVEFTSVAAAKACAADGLGITLLPEFALAAKPDRTGLVPLPWDEGQVEAAVLMIRHKDKWLSPGLSRFMEIVRTLLPGAMLV